MKMVSEAAYLEAERQAESKHEFWAGTVTPAPESDFRHAVLMVRAQVRCAMQLRNSNWCAVSSIARVYIETARAFVYPDVLVAPHAPAFYDDAHDTITNPRVIIEIVAQATREHDRGPKLLAYRTMPSLMDYVLVVEDEIAVEHHQRKADGVWRCAKRGPGSALILESVGVEVAVNDMYRRV